MQRTSGEPGPEDPRGVPGGERDRTEDAEEAARQEEEDAARAENEGYPLGRPERPGRRRSAR